MNEVTTKMILDLDKKHSNAIPIFGGARFCNGIADIVKALPRTIHNAKFFRWHDTVANACRTFCRLCLVDPALVECYIGMRFEELTEED